MAQRIEHTTLASAAMHIMLTVAMYRLGMTEMEVTEAEYAAATEGFGDLRVMFDGVHYRAIRQPGMEG